MISLLHKSKMNHHISRHESYDSFSSFHEDVNSPLTCYNNSKNNNEGAPSSNFPMNSIPLSKVPKIGYIMHDNGSFQTESREAPAKYSSVTNKPKSNSTKLNVIGEHDSVDSGLLKENLIQLEMLPQVYLENCVQFDLPSLVLKANIGMKKGVKPVLADGAMGGTYFLRDENQKFAVVCKPGDEEPNSPHNPHQTKPGEAVWRGWYRGRIVPGFGMYREVAAFLLDAGFAGVPPTQLARVRDYLLRLDAEPLEQSNIGSAVSQNQNKVCEPLPSSSASVYKICSVQSYARHECSAEDMGSSKFHTDDVHRIAALDIRLCNLDRHEGNILVCKSNPYIRNISDDEGADCNIVDNNDTGGKYHLVPIDHGYVLPHVLCMNDPSLSWMNWPQSREPLSPSLLRHIASLDYTRDAELLRRVVGAALAETSLLTLQVCTSFLKKGSAAGLTLYEMGSAMCPPDYNQDQPNSIPSTNNNNTHPRKSSHHSAASSSSHTNHNPNQPISQLQKVVHIAVHNVLLMQTSRTSSFSKTDFDNTYSSSAMTAVTTTENAADFVVDEPMTSGASVTITPTSVISSDPQEDAYSASDNLNDDHNTKKATATTTTAVAMMDIDKNVHISCSSIGSSGSSIMSVSPVSVTQLLEFEEEERVKESIRTNKNTAATVSESVMKSETATTVIASLSQSNLKKHTTGTSNTGNTKTSNNTSVHYKSILSQTTEKIPSYTYNNNHINSNSHINSSETSHHHSPAPSIASTSSKSSSCRNNHHSNHFLTRSLTLSYAAVVVCGGGLYHSKNSRSSSVDETITTSVTESTVRVTEEMLFRALYIDKTFQTQQQYQQQQQQKAHHHHHNKSDSSSVTLTQAVPAAMIHSVLEYEMDIALDKLVSELLAARDKVEDEEAVGLPSSSSAAVESTVTAATAFIATVSTDDNADDDDDIMCGVDVGVD